MTSRSSRSTPARRCSTKRSRPAGKSSPVAEPSLWVVVNGTPTQRPLSWREWKKKPWVERLSGTIQAPSRAARSAGKWARSLPDSHASRGRTRARGSASGIRDGSGLTSLASFAELGPGSCFWKTCRLSFALQTPKTRPDGAILLELGLYCETLPRWGSMRNGVLYRRTRWAPPTNGSGGSASPCTTPCATDSGRKSKYQQGGTALSAQAQCPTPRAHEVGDYQRDKGQKGKERSTLSGLSRNLCPTPKTPQRRGDCPSERARHSPDLDSTALGLCPTPKVVRGGANCNRKARGAGGPDLQEMVENLCPTPNVPNGGRRLPKRARRTGTNTAQMPDGRKVQVGLEDAVMRRCPTPGAADGHKAPKTYARGNPSLPHLAETSSPSSPQVPTDGAPSGTPPSPQRLNPAFVCWLMGWPWWWTHPERISFASAEMASWRSRLRSQLSCLVGG